MKKPTNKFYSDPTQHPEFEKTQAKWYKKLEAEGFEDIEDCKHGGYERTSTGKLLDANHGGRNLKQWSGSSVSLNAEDVNKNKDSSGVLDQLVTQPPNSPIVSSFPESLFKREEEFMNHPEFKKVCKSISSHGNSDMTSRKIAAIWISYCNGDSFRLIGRAHKIHNTTVMRTIRKLTEWLDFLDAEKGGKMDAKVVVRPCDLIKDVPFIYSTWRNSLFYDKKRNPSTAPTFFKAANRQLHEVLSSPSVRVNVACLEDDSDHIIGYAVLADTNIEFVYVKKDYRGNGIASVLTKGFSTVSNPQTKIGKAIVQKKSFAIKENK